MTVELSPPPSPFSQSHACSLSSASSTTAAKFSQLAKDTALLPTTTHKLNVSQMWFYIYIGYQVARNNTFTVLICPQVQNESSKIPKCLAEREQRGIEILKIDNLTYIWE